MKVDTKDDGRTVYIAHSGVAVFFNRFQDRESGAPMVSVRVNKQLSNQSVKWETVASFYAEVKAVRELGVLLSKI